MKKVTGKITLFSADQHMTLDQEDDKKLSFRLTNGNGEKVRAAGLRLGDQVEIEYEKADIISVKKIEKVLKFPVKVLAASREMMRVQTALNEEQCFAPTGWENLPETEQEIILLLVQQGEGLRPIGWEPVPESDRPPPPPVPDPKVVAAVEAVPEEIPPPAPPPPAPAPAAAEPASKLAAPEPGFKTGKVLSITPVEGRFPASIELEGTGQILFLGKALPAVGQKIELWAVPNAQDVLCCQAWQLAEPEEIPATQPVSDSKLKRGPALPKLRAKIAAAWAARPKWQFTLPKWPGFKFQIPAWASKPKFWIPRPAKKPAAPKPKPPTSDSKPKWLIRARVVVFLGLIVLTFSLLSFGLGRLVQQVNEAGLAQQVASLQQEVERQGGIIVDLNRVLGEAQAKIREFEADGQRHRREIDALKDELKLAKRQVDATQVAGVSVLCGELQAAAKAAGWQANFKNPTNKKPETCEAYFLRKLDAGKK